MFRCVISDYFIDLKPLDITKLKINIKYNTLNKIIRCHSGIKVNTYADFKTSILVSTWKIEFKMYPKWDRHQHKNDFKKGSGAQLHAHVKY